MKQKLAHAILIDQLRGVVTLQPIRVMTLSGRSVQLAPFRDEPRSFFSGRSDLSSCLRLVVSQGLSIIRHGFLYKTSTHPLRSPKTIYSPSPLFAGPGSLVV